MAQPPDSDPEPQKRPDRWDLLRKRLLWIYRAEKEGARQMRRPGCQSAVLVLNGYLEITCDREPVRTEPGHWIITPFREFRIQSIGPKSEFLSVGWEAEWPNHLPLFDDGLPVVLTREQGAELEQSSERLYQAVHGNRQSINWATAVQHPHESLDQLLAEEEAFAAWMRCLARTLSQRGIGISSTPQLDSRVERMLLLLQKLPAAEPLAKESLAAEVGLGWRRLKDLFIADMGMTPHEYVDARRLKLAGERLLSGSETPKEIAYTLGFKHLSHFSSWFRKHRGVSPRQFARENFE